MLRLFVENVDMCFVSKLLVKYKVKATIRHSIIEIYGTITEDLATQLYNNIKITCFNNYDDVQEDIPDKSTKIEKTEIPISSKSDIIEEDREEKVFTQDTSSVEKKSGFVLRYQNVKRAEVYFCDFGNPFEHEQGGKRYAIVIQNDDGNKYSPNTIVLPCTTKPKPNLPVHYSFNFSSENMVDYSPSIVDDKVNIVLGEAITTVSKSRLFKYLGKMSEEFMDTKIQPIIERSLALKRDIPNTGISQTTKIELPQKQIIYVKDDLNPIQKAIATYRDLNLEQIHLLSYINIDELISISNSSAKDYEKAYKILQLFGFDFSQNGVQYLLDAISISPKSEYFNLQTLTQKLAEVKEYTIDASEIQRLIIARVKERFKFKKSPTVDFIRLVNRLLTKKEEENNEDIV